ncbi:MAG: HAD-IIIA family hydrolase [Campylobacterota bacterium]|nr:HAD-IIIA family hydrolase [Campylobacterota bacterium]
MIKLIVLDVDGCLTDGKITYTAEGDEIKSFNVKDGLAIKTWMRMGNEVAIITGRKSAIVKRRADELGIVHLYQGVSNKSEVLAQLADELNIDASQIAAIGDDLNDYKMLKFVGHAFVPNNASHYLKAVSDTVLQQNGGEASVREMIEQIVRESDRETDFLAFWQ